MAACTLHVSSQPSMISLNCPNSTCQLMVQTPQGNLQDCYSNAPSKSIIWSDNTIVNIHTCTDCYIDDCNRVYTICNTTQSQSLLDESSPECRELSSRVQTLHSNEQPINCTVNILRGHIIRLDCPKGECLHTAKASSTTCNMDLGIDCEGEKRSLFL